MSLRTRYDYRNIKPYKSTPHQSHEVEYIKKMWEAEAKAQRLRDRRSKYLKFLLYANFCGILAIFGGIYVTFWLTGDLGDELPYVAGVCLVLAIILSVLLDKILFPYLADCLDRKRKNKKRT